MNICIKDIYLFFLSLIVFYLLYSKNNESFQATTTGYQATTTGYQADVEAIRNLSSIATELTKSNQVTMPGSLNVTNSLTVSGELSVRTGNPGKQIMLGTSQIKFRGDGVVHYALTNDTDGKFKISNVSGNSAFGVGHVNDCLVTDRDGNTSINGTLTTKSVNNAVPNIVVLTSGTNANWVIPTGVFRCKVTCVGAGGGGAGGASFCKGGGGGGGSLCIKVFNNLTPGSNAVYTIGVGGTGGSGVANGTIGGNTSFTWSGTTIVANGGAGGVFKSDGGINLAASGGTATGGDINIIGGSGGCGQTINVRAVLHGMSNGGNAPLGYGLGGVDPVSNMNIQSTGKDGTGYGGGGSGGYAAVTENGGKGSNGVIIIEY